MSQLRVAACQILTYPDIEKSTNKIIEWIKTAVKDNVDVVSFPEGTICGYLYDRAEYEKIGPAPFIEAENKIINVLKDLNIAVIVGTVHWEKENIFNDLLVIDKKGVVRGRYSKIRLPENEKWPISGPAIPVYTVAGVKSCFLICADIRWSEIARLAVLNGAQICYFCAHEAPLIQEYKMTAYRAMPIARAADNNIYVVMANCPADPNSVGINCSHGNSKIIEPEGNVIEEARHFEERLVAATIDIDKATCAYAQAFANNNTILKDWLNQGTKIVTVHQ